MPAFHLLLALIVVTIWGCNFVFIKFGLDEISPFLFCALRFLLSCLPAIFFIKPPAAPFRLIVLYGLLTFALQFTLLFLGMYLGMTPGLASLLIQVQVFFSILFAVIFLGEIPNFWQIVGALVSFAGIGLIATHLDNNVTLAGFILIIAAAASWGIGNLISKKIGHVNMISLVVWGSFVASIPLLILSVLLEGPTQIMNSINHMTWLGVLSVVYVVYASTWVGYGVWNWLLNHYPVAVVAPFTLLVPIIGMISSILILDEPFQHWKLITGVLVITGLCINLLGTRYSLKKKLEEEANIRAATIRERVQQ